MRNGARNLSKIAISRARQLRQEMSFSEETLWKRLRGHRTGYGFRRNHAYLSYWLDFYCREARLCVEVDGDQHELRRDRDALRDARLAEEGILTLRIPSVRVLEETDLVVLEIMALCEERTGRPPRFRERELPAPRTRKTRP